MPRTVSEMAALAGVSARTLHYYDEIGLLPPSAVGGNGYRYYDEPALVRLQQILFYRELGLSLGEIKSVLDTPGFDAMTALRTHRKRLHERAKRIQSLLGTVEKTIKHLEGVEVMSESEYFSGFGEEQQAEYEQEVIERWGADSPAYQQSKARWGSYSADRRQEVLAEGQSITLALAGLTDREPSDPEVQQWIARQHQWVNYFWDCEPEQLAALGETYASDPRFAAMYASYHPDLPQFIRAAIQRYVEIGGERG